MESRSKNGLQKSMASFGGNDRPSGQVVTQNVQEPWTHQQPHLKNIFSEAENLYNSETPQYFEGNTVAGLSDQTKTALDLQEARALQGSPLVNQAQDQLSTTLSGGYLNNNPHLQNAIDAASEGVVRNYQTATSPGIDSAFERAGRYGSNAYQTMKKNSEAELADSLGRMSSQMAYGDYNRERGFMNNAIQLADSLSQSDYNDIAQLAKAGSIYDAQNQAELASEIDRFNFEQMKPFNKLAQYSGLVSGGYGSTATSTQPYFRNTGANVLSGALGGLGAAGSLGGGMGDFGTWALGGLGALGGLL